mmetsp:Transcript_1994/g.4979  ORF Transcript_1994/g.4979 Transcript_1994/m.4979 type:complete len:123 (-) Transcript_1994:71-439(-)
MLPPPSALSSAKKRPADDYTAALVAAYATKMKAYQPFADATTRADKSSYVSGIIGRIAKAATAAGIVPLAPGAPGPGRCASSERDTAQGRGTGGAGGAMAEGAAQGCNMRRGNRFRPKVRYV